MSTLRDRILGNGEPLPLETREVAVKSWGVTVKVIQLDAVRLKEFFDAAKEKDSFQQKVCLVACSTFDIEGSRLLYPDDIPRLLQNPPGGVMEIWSVADDLNPWIFGKPEKNAASAGASPSA